MDLFLFQTTAQPEIRLSYIVLTDYNMYKMLAWIHNLTPLLDNIVLGRGGVDFWLVHIFMICTEILSYCSLWENQEWCLQVQ